MQICSVMLCKDFRPRGLESESFILPGQGPKLLIKRTAAARHIQIILIQLPSQSVEMFDPLVGKLYHQRAREQLLDL